MRVHFTVSAGFELPLSLHFLGVDLLFGIYRLPSSPLMLAAPETHSTLSRSQLRTEHPGRLAGSGSTSGVIGGCWVMRKNFEMATVFVGHVLSFVFHSCSLYKVRGLSG